MSISDIEILKLSEMNWEKIMSGTIKGTASSKENGVFRTEHTLRVRDIVRQLLLTEVGADPQKAEIMALVHDMYKYTDDDNHGATAAIVLRKAYVEPYLKAGEEWMPKKLYAKEKEEWKKVYEALTLHSDKGIKTESLESRTNAYLRLIQDADMLDHLSIEYVNGVYKNWYTPDEGEKDLLRLPVILKYLRKVLNYEGKTTGWFSVRNNMLRKLNTIAMEDGYSNTTAELYYESSIYPILPKVIREEIDMHDDYE